MTKQNADIIYYEDLIETFLKFQADESLKSLVDIAKDFLARRHEITDFFVFSCPAGKAFNDGREPLKWLRTLEGRDRLVGHPHLEEQLLKVLNESNFADAPTLISIQEKSWQYIPFGQFEDQFIFSLGFVKKQTIKPVHPYLTQLLQKYLTDIARWREVGKFESLIYVDDVTLLYNQRKLVKDIDLAVKNYQERKEPFAVLFIDIDHFKQVNDNHGHLVGTQLLADVASVLRTLLRESDLCYRYGGDEFVLLVPDATLENGKAIGERILATITNHVFSVDEKLLVSRITAGEGQVKAEKHEFKLSVSVGVASFPQDAKNAQEILDIADQMMYEAKNSGRGRVCFTDDLFNKKKSGTK